MNYYRNSYNVIPLFNQATEQASNVFMRHKIGIAANS